MRSFLTAVLFACALICTSGCERKPLYLRISQAQIKVQLDLELELVWGLSWKTEWQYTWDESISTYGPIGYTTPEWVRATIYGLNTETGSRISQFTQNFSADGGRVSLVPGSWYDILFYNAGTEYILFDTDKNNTYYTATTRTGETKVYSRATAAASQPTRTYTDYKQPDELIGVMTDSIFVSENPDEYEKVINENGEMTYIYKIEAELEPYSFIYLFQVMLVNNTDSVGRRVTGGSGMTVTGLSRGTELFSRKTFDDVISITLDEMKPTQNDIFLTLPDSTKAVGDVFAARMVTWGLPGINPIKEFRNPDEDGVEYPDDNWVNLCLKLRNGGEYVVSYDITEQMRAKPAGGVITIVVDTSKAIPDEELEKKKTTTGGGFSADVSPWQNEYNQDITI